MCFSNSEIKSNLHKKACHSVNITPVMKDNGLYVRHASQGFRPRIISNKTPLIEKYNNALPENQKKSVRMDPTSHEEIFRLFLSN